jgi:hypothetical protein
MRRTIVALCAALAFGAAHAEPADMLFNTPHLAGVSAGSALVYDHVRHSDPALGIGPDFDQAIAVRMGEGAAESFTLNAEGTTPRTFDVNDGVPGNPLLMVFLENALRSVSQATGGSPFYLRNRMREALAGSLVEEDGALTMQPFLNDENREKLGVFADMALRFEVSETTPGMLVSMVAQAGPAEAPVYKEEIRYEAVR